MVSVDTAAERESTMSYLYTTISNGISSDTTEMSDLQLKARVFAVSRVEQANKQSIGGL